MLNQMVPMAFWDGLVDGLFGEFAKGIGDALNNVIVSVATLWMNVPSPTVSGGSAPTVSGTADTANAIQILSWLKWGGIALVVGALMVAAALLAVRHGRDTTSEGVGRIGKILAGAIVIGAAAAISGAVVPAGPNDAAGVTGFVQQSIWWWVGFATIAGLIVGGIRLAWTQRAEAGKDIVRQLITLIIVTGAATAVVSTALAATDAFSEWVLKNGSDCTEANCLSANMAGSMVTPIVGQQSAVLVIILGFVAVFAALIQMILMVARTGVIVLLLGVLPLSAATTSSRTGQEFFRKNVGWLAGFILYKPVAALIYAASFQLAGTKPDSGGDAFAAVSGLALMIVALIALPALMRLITPAAMSIGSGGGGGGGAAVASGAVSVAGFAGQHGGESSDSSASGAQSTTGGGGSAGGGPSGSDTGAKRSAGSGQASGETAGGASGASGGAAASSAGAAGGGSAASGAAAAAGPPGMIAAAAIQAGSGVANGAKEVAGEATEGGQ